MYNVHVHVHVAYVCIERLCSNVTSMYTCTCSLSRIETAALSASVSILIHVV